MALEQYIAKRDFSQTPEPKNGEPGKMGALRFVVQRHQASTLHYDFRLEVDGVLKSWAVPKGPSMNRTDKRLAVQVEDHPWEYRTFEGEIPEGNYGAGTVQIWDQGTSHAETSDGREGSEQEMRQGLEKGSLRFVLAGERLRGAFSLVQIKKGEADTWLLMKKKDQEATKSPYNSKACAKAPNAPTGGAKAAKKERSARVKRADSEKADPSDKKQPTGRDTVSVDIEGYSLSLTNLDKVYWPEEGYTKADLIHYYRQVARYLLPYLQDRPQALHRHPNGLKDEGFYQKDAGDQVPEWVQTESIYSESSKRDVHYILCQNEATLTYLNNLGCIIPGTPG